MTISLFPVTPDFAAEVGDVDLAKPLRPKTSADPGAFLSTRAGVFPHSV